MDRLPPRWVPNHHKVFDGMVRFLHGDTAFAARGRRIYRSADGGKSWRKVATLPYAGFPSLAAKSKLLNRLCRASVNHILPLDEQTLAVFGFRRIYRVNWREGHSTDVALISGSRPLVPCVSAGSVWYGEYFSNRERKPVRVWNGSDGGSRWEPVHTFENVRHIHSISRDAYTGYLWVTTGDTDSESALWMTPDNFRTVEKVVGGSQQTRVVQPLFTENSIFFGSDTPLERNHIYRFDRGSGRIERLQQVDGSVFWGCTVGANLFFSTACEPSQVNSANRAVVWRGSEGGKWERYCSFKKDLWPKKLFQYGQVLFPAGPGSDNSLWVSPFATERDQSTFKIPLA